MATINRTVTKAQQICLSKIETISNYYMILAEALEHTNFFSDVEVLLTPWNKGYVIKMEARINHEKLTSDKEKEFNSLHKLYFNTARCYLQPCSFLEDYLREGHTYLEGQLPDMNENYKSWSEAQNLGSIEDIANSAEIFKDTCCSLLRAAIEKVNELKS